MQMLEKNKKLIMFLLAFVLLSFFIYRKYKGKNEDSNDSGNWIPEKLPLAQGMQGDRVMNIQKALNKRRGTPIKQDGLYGSETEAAILDAGYESPIEETEYYEITGGLIKWVR